MDAVSASWRRGLAAIAVGLVYFAALIGAAQGLVALNATTSAAVPWFPLPALLLAWFVTRWLARHWELRLGRPTVDPAWRIYAAALLATFAAMCMAVLEGAFQGLDRVAPRWPAEVSAAFDWSFLITLPLLAGVLAEIAFRGVIQTALEKVLPLWPMLLLIAVLNALFHFYDPEQASQWLRYIALNLAFGYAAWRAQSIRPALVAHVAMNLVEPLAARVYGPVALGDLPTGGLISIAMMGAASLLAAIVLFRSSGGTCHG